MFDLEQAIIAWRQQMLAAGIKSPVPLEELENHLREEIEQQTKSGRSEAEAFESAVQRLGQIEAVQGEFEKIPRTKDALHWKFLEITFGLFASVFPWCLYRTVLHFKPGYLADLTPGQQTSSVAAVALFVLLAWSGRLGCKLLPLIRAKRTRDIATVFCAAPVLLWWIIFMNCIVPRHDFDMGQLTVVILWGFITPAGAVLGLSWGIEAAARNESAAFAS